MYGMKVKGISETRGAPSSVVDEQNCHRMNTNLGTPRLPKQKNKSSIMNWIVAGLFAMWLLAFAIGTAALIKIIMFEHDFQVTKEILHQSKRHFVPLKQKNTDLNNTFKRLCNLTGNKDKVIKGKVDAMYQALAIKEIDLVSDEQTWNGAEKKCSKNHLQLCELNDIFPENIEPLELKRFERKSRLVAIRGLKNTWVEMGVADNRKFGKLLHLKDDEIPEDEDKVKKNKVLCCYPFSH